MKICESKNMWIHNTPFIYLYSNLCQFINSIFFIWGNSNIMRKFSHLSHNPTPTPTYYEPHFLNPSTRVYREGYLGRARHRVTHSSAYRPPHSRGRNIYVNVYVKYVKFYVKDVKFYVKDVKIFACEFELPLFYYIISNKI